MIKNDVVIFESKDKEITLSVQMDGDTVWLTQSQITELFDVDRTAVTRHVNNVFKEGELDRESNVQKMHIPNSDRPVQFYSLDVIISVGYRVKSVRGVEFRKWANKVLKDYVLQGYAVNEKRIQQLGSAIRLMKRVEEDLDSRQVLDVIERYNTALDFLDDYDHQTLKRPKGSGDAYVLSYEECRELIESMKFAGQSELFGNEKDDSFKGTIGNIYQSFAGQDIYPFVEEKAANLLYLITKNHSFSDGNKRIAAAMFLYFLDRNGLLFDDEGNKRMDDHTLVALTIMIAESKPEEKEMMISVIMNCIS